MEFSKRCSGERTKHGAKACCVGECGLADSLDSVPLSQEDARSRDNNDEL